MRFPERRHLRLGTLVVPERRGVARLSLDSQVLTAAGEVAVRFNGQFVLQRESTH